MAKKTAPKKAAAEKAAAAKHGICVPLEGEDPAMYATEPLEGEGVPEFDERGRNKASAAYIRHFHPAYLARRTHLP